MDVYCGHQYHPARGPLSLSTVTSAAASLHYFDVVELMRYDAIDKLAAKRKRLPKPDQVYLLGHMLEALNTAHNCIGQC
jgi:hypothetical protein